MTLVLRRQLKARWGGSPAWPVRPVAVAIDPASGPDITVNADTGEEFIHVHGRNYARVLWVHVPVKAIIVLGPEDNYAMWIRENARYAKSMGGERRYMRGGDYVWRRLHNG